MENKICDFGCGREAKFVLKMGKSCCCESSNSCPEMRRKNSESLKGKKKNGCGPKYWLGKTAWSKGKTYEEIMGKEKAGEYKTEKSKSLLGRKWKASTEEIEKKRRLKISASAKKNGKSGGYRRTSGRGKYGWYKGIWCDSSWELAWVIFNLDHGILFERNKDRFKYKWEGEEHQYLPDFRMSDGKLVEIKAWLDDKGRAKLAACPGIQVLMKKEMEPFLRYVVEKFGKDFVKMYERSDAVMVAGPP
jgi:hypothetical protein